MHLFSKAAGHYTFGRFHYSAILSVVLLVRYFCFRFGGFLRDAYFYFVNLGLKFSCFTDIEFKSIQ